MPENEKLEEQKAKIIKTLATMFDYLGLNGNFRVEEKGAKLAVKIASEDAGRIIGRKGQTLESLQLVLNRIMFKDNEEFPHVLLDIDGYGRGEREFREGGDRPRRERRPRREDGGHT
ncbi:MAG: KH domain-containing protein, partial [Lentisphaeria bacterium]|nr:KH domain-containing protein [Lentisphaeria bacterium]